MLRSVIITYLLILVPISVYSSYNTESLEAHIPFSEQVKNPNTKYVIKYDFSLDGDVLIPNNCILKFDGGSLKGKCTLIGNNTVIEAGLVKILDTYVTIAGSWSMSEVYPEWFGAIGDGVTNCTPAFNALLHFCYSNGKKDISCVPIKLGKGVYILESPIIIPLDQNQYWYNRNKDREIFKDMRNSFTLIGSGYMTTTLKAGIHNTNFLFTSDDNIEQYKRKPRLKNVIIKNITFSGSFVCPTCFGTWSTLQIFNNEFENVVFTEFSNIAVDVERIGDTMFSSSQNSECNWRNVHFKYNYIGMRFNGASSSFYGCRWERNYYRGLIVNADTQAMSFYESLIQYNCNIDKEYIPNFKEQKEYPGNLVFENVGNIQVNFHGSYFEPSIDSISQNNYPPIQVLQNAESPNSPEINIEDCYCNLFTDFIKIIRTDYRGDQLRNKKCFASNINIKNLKVARTNKDAYILAFHGQYLTLVNSFFSVHDKYSILGSAVLDTNKNYDKLSTVYVDIPKYGTSSARPDYLIGLGQTYFDTDLQRLLVRTEQFSNPNMQIWVDSEGFSPVKKVGTYEDKPTSGLTLNDVGFAFFVTNLGKPIYWTGDTNKGDNGWVDANGNHPSQQ